MSANSIPIRDHPDHGSIVDNKDILVYLSNFNETERKIFVDMLHGSDRPLDGWYVSDVADAIHEFYKLVGVPHWL